MEEKLRVVVAILLFAVLLFACWKIVDALGILVQIAAFLLMAGYVYTVMRERLLPLPSLIIALVSSGLVVLLLGDVVKIVAWLVLSWFAWKLAIKYVAPEIIEDLQEFLEGRG